VVFMLVSPIAASAQDAVQQGLNNVRSTGQFPITVLGQSGNSPIQVIGAVIRLMLWIAGVLAIVFVIIGGYQYMTSLGNDEKAAAGRKTLTYAIIGLVIIILAYVLVQLVVKVAETGKIT